MDRVKSAWLSLANCCRVPSQMTSVFAAFSLRRCDMLQHTVDHGLFSCVNVFRAHGLAKLSVVSEAVERYAVSVSDLLQLGRICHIQRRSERTSLAVHWLLGR